MSASSSDDPAHETVTASSRAVLMAATVAAEQVARHWRNQAERQQAASAGDAGRWSERYDAQRRLARIEVGAADQRWVDGVGLDQVARVWETTHAWSQLEPAEFGPESARIRGLVRDKYGVDLATPDAGATADRLHRAAEHEHELGTQDRAERRDATAAAVVTATAGADREHDRAEDAAATTPRAVAQHDQASNGLDAIAYDYDSEARRSQLVERAMEYGTEPDVAEGRARAANAQARPVRQATQPPARRTPARAPSWDAVRRRDPQRGR